MQLTVLVVQHLHNKLVPFEATFLVYQTIQKQVGRRQNSASMNVILPFPLLSDCQIRIKKKITLIKSMNSE